MISGVLFEAFAPFLLVKPVYSTQSTIIRRYILLLSVPKVTRDLNSLKDNDT